MTPDKLIGRCLRVFTPVRWIPSGRASVDVTPYPACGRHKWRPYGHSRREAVGATGFSVVSLENSRNVGASFMTPGGPPDDVPGFSRPGDGFRQAVRRLTLRRVRRAGVTSGAPTGTAAGEAVGATGFSVVSLENSCSVGAPFMTPDKLIGRCLRVFVPGRRIPSGRASVDVTPCPACRRYKWRPYGRCRWCVMGRREYLSKR